MHPGNAGPLPGTPEGPSGSTGHRPLGATHHADPLGGEAERFLGSGPFTVEQLPHVPAAGATQGLFRVLAADGRSAVVKVLHQGSNPRWPASPDPGSPWWWRREAAAYGSSALVDRLAAAGLRMPRLFGIADRGVDVCALWLEDLTGAPGTCWPTGRLAAAAGCFGRLAGAGPLAAGDRAPARGQSGGGQSARGQSGGGQSARGQSGGGQSTGGQSGGGQPARWQSGGGQPARGQSGGGRSTGGPPSARWLSDGWLRSYVRLRDGEAAAFDRPWGDLEHLRGSAERLWAERDRWLAVLDDLPRTLSHLDLWPGNLFDDAGTTVLTDWAYAGTAALGEDLGNLVPDSVSDLRLPAASRDAVDTATWSAFADALPGHCDIRAARLGFCASSAVKFAWLVPRLAGLADREAWAARRGTSYAAWRHAFRAAADLVQDRAAEARTLTRTR